MIRCLALTLIALLLGACSKSPESAESASTRFVKIGTGAKTGVYYPTGQAIADLVNRRKADYGLNVSVESTGGSVFNVNTMLTGDMEFGIVQSDIQYQAIHGQGAWADRGPQPALRAVFAIHPELVTLVAADDTGIRSIGDLKGKRVNLDSPGSGTAQNAMQILAAFGLDPDKDMQAQRLSVKEAPGLLQDNRIDAFFFTAAHPNGSLIEATAGTRTIRFVPIVGPPVDALIEQSPYLAKSHIPAAFYPKAANEEDVATVGVKATLMTTLDVPEEVVYAITSEVFNNLPKLKKMHEAYTVLTPDNMLEGLSAPIHPGAQRYFREAGIVAGE